MGALQHRRPVEPRSEPELDTFTREFFRLRQGLAVLPLVLLAAIVVTDASPARKVLLGAAVAGMLVLIAREQLKGPSRARSRSVFQLNLTIMAALHLVATLATGGVDSPVAVGTLPLAFVSAMLVDERLGRGIVLVQCAATVGCTVLQGARVSDALVPELFGGGAHVGSRALVLTRGLVLSVGPLLAFKVGRWVRASFDQMVARAVDAREEVLEKHVEDNRQLIALAAEIAHELKNPLASVKGLAGLVARDVDRELGDKPRERMGILRREVDRIEGIVEEFLNFSRPLSPLSLSAVDLRALAAEVVALHEAVARERGVELELRPGEALSVRCDARKIKQIMLNLVLNAVEATPRGERIELAVERDRLGSAECATVRVVDGGPGLSPDVADRAFEPGVTTKSGGSGIGLTVSRTLARQHGGDLVLASSARGCTAALLLPIGAEAAAPEARAEEVPT
ncbi:MAG: HAMP domain-containing sensor histidine kinase [Polyangiaceae bacterium]